MTEAENALTRMKPSEMTRAQVLEAIDILTRCINAVDSKVTKAKGLAAAGEGHADPDWYSRARHALRTYSARRQALYLRLGEINRAERRAVGSQSNIAWRFVAIARRRLKEDVFNEMMEEARDEASK